MSEFIDYQSELEKLIVDKNTQINSIRKLGEFIGVPAQNINDCSQADYELWISLYRTAIEMNVLLHLYEKVFPDKDLPIKFDVPIDEFRDFLDGIGNQLVKKLDHV